MVSIFKSILYLFIFGNKTYMSFLFNIYVVFCIRRKILNSQNTDDVNSIVLASTYFTISLFWLFLKRKFEDIKRVIWGSKSMVIWRGKSRVIWGSKSRVIWSSKSKNKKIQWPKVKGQLLIKKNILHIKLKIGKH